jgi:putative endonuclease
VNGVSAGSRQRLGRAGEQAVARWYRRRGYRIVQRNWRCREGELDLVVERDRVLVFCEVKTRSSVAFGHPAEAVTEAKQRRVRKLAMRYLESRPHRGPLRFDVAAVLPDHIEVIENAF